MNKGLFFIGIAFLFTSYHVFVNNTISVGMYQTNINNENIINIVGTVMLFFAFVIIFISFQKRI